MMLDTLQLMNFAAENEKLKAFSDFLKRDEDLARRFDLHVHWKASSLEFALAKYFSERHAILRILSAILHHEVSSLCNIII